MDAGYIGIAGSNRQTFRNTTSNDLVFFTPNPSKFVIGTRSNQLSTVQITGSNLVVNGNLQVTSGAGIQGTTTIYNDLIVRGNIITQQDLVLSGVQIAAGASYCNGDLFVTNNTIGEPTSNATVFVSSLNGLPMLSLQQNFTDDTKPFVIYQSLNGNGSVECEYDVHFKTSNQIYSTFTSNGFMGLGTQEPKARLDIADGNINANNIHKIYKSTSNNSPINIRINWTYQTYNRVVLIVSTLQQLRDGTRTQKHRIIMDPYNYDHVPQVAIGEGVVTDYCMLDTEVLYATETSMIFNSICKDNNNESLHEISLSIDMANSELGHIWLD